jgi:hypothetical protein
VTRLPAEKPGNGGSNPNTARDFALCRSVIMAVGPTGVQWVMESLFLNVMGAESKADCTPTHHHSHICLHGVHTDFTFCGCMAYILTS